MRLTAAAIAMLAVSVESCALFKQQISAGGILKDSYTAMSANQFESLVNSVNWGNGETRNRCTNAMCTTKDSVRIDANMSSYGIDSLNGGAQGTLVARAQNIGSLTTIMYHFRPGPYRYYFLVRRSGANSRWILLEHQTGSSPDSVAGGPFKGCFDHPPAVVAHADFRDCDPRIYPASKDTRILAVAAPTAAISARGSDPAQYSEAAAWIGCKYGCCPMPF